MSISLDDSQEPEAFDDSPAVADVVFLTEEDCRFPGPQRICGGPSSCTRKGHASFAGERPPPGVYRSAGMLRGNSTVPDAAPGGFLMTLEEYYQTEDQRVADQLVENRAVGLEPAVQASFASSPLKDAPTQEPTEVESLGLKLPGMGSAVKAGRKVFGFLGQSIRVPGVPTVPPPSGGGPDLLREAEEKRAQMSRDLNDLEASVARARMGTSNPQPGRSVTFQADRDIEDRTAAIMRDLQAMALKQAGLERELATILSQGRNRMPPQPTTAPGGPLPRGTKAYSHFPSGADNDVDCDTIYGIPKNYDSELMTAILPPEMDSTIKGELESLLPDVVSPTTGTFMNATDQDDVTTGFVNALDNHSRFLHQQKGGRVKQDASWNISNRVGLYKVKSEHDFSLLFGSYQRQERDFGKIFGERVESVLVYYGMAREQAQLFAQTSRYTNLCTKAHCLYGYLLNHLDKSIAQSGFKAIKSIIELFATDLVGHRQALSRTNMWFNTYVYLRNLYQRNFWTVERQTLLNRTFLEGVPSGAGETQPSEGQAANPKCNHCQGHPKGTPCVLKDYTRNEARKMAKEAKAKGGNYTKALKKVMEERDVKEDDN